MPTPARSSTRTTKAASTAAGTAAPARGSKGRAKGGVGPGPVAGGAPLEAEILGVGAALGRAIGELVAAVGVGGTGAGGAGGPGPVALGRALGVDKVLASRVLKALRRPDPAATLFFMPGPEPLRVLVKAAERRGVDGAAAERAAAAIADYQRLIDVQVGDRSLLDSILSAWIPEARAEFELRRKQAAFKAMSQLRGVQADAVLATCIVAPSADPALMDVVWVHGLTGLHRVRPGAVVKLASRRMSPEPGERRAQTLAGERVGADAPPLAREFCSEPTPPVEVRRAGDSLFYTLGGEGFGAASAVDVVFVEINRAEMKRRPAPRPGDAPGEARGAYFFAEVSAPAKALQLDMVVHRALFPGQDPRLVVHDTAFDGVADVFDRRRDLDRLDLLETVTPLGTGLSRVRSGAVARYPELLARALAALGWGGAGGGGGPEEFRAYRCAVEYPLYGSQVSMVWGAGA